LGQEISLEHWVASGAILGLGRYAFLDISLPGFVVSYPAFGLFACKFHFLGYVIDPGSSIFLLVKAVARRPEIDFVSKGPFCFYFVGGLDAPSLWHAAASFQEVF
jgi:hypothetical protein